MPYNNNDDELTAGKIILYIVITLVVIFGFTALLGGYDNVDTEQIVPLFRILIPYLLVIGTPVILTLIILAIVKSINTGHRLAKEALKPRNKTGQYIKHTPIEEEE